jgi:hypothetical protein
MSYLAKLRVWRGDDGGGERYLACRGGMLSDGVCDGA